MILAPLVLAAALISGYECVCVAEPDEVWCVCDASAAPPDEIRDESPSE